MARKNVADAAKAKAEKQKKIVIGLGVVLALAMAYAVHTMMAMNKSRRVVEAAGRCGHDGVGHSGSGRGDAVGASGRPDARWQPRLRPRRPPARSRRTS